MGWLYDYPLSPDAFLFDLSNLTVFETETRFVDIEGATKPPQEHFELKKLDFARQNLAYAVKEPSKTLVVVAGSSIALTVEEYADQLAKIGLGPSGLADGVNLLLQYPDVIRGSRYNDYNIVLPASVFRPPVRRRDQPLIVVRIAGSGTDPEGSVHVLGAKGVWEGDPKKFKVLTPYVSSYRVKDFVSTASTVFHDARLYKVVDQELWDGREAFADSAIDRCARDQHFVPPERQLIRDRSQVKVIENDSFGYRIKYARQCPQCGQKTEVPEYFEAEASDCW